MAVNALNRVTLTNAIDDEQVSFVVSSTASIADGDLLAIRGTRGLEIALVQDIPQSGTVNVKRGVMGTAAAAANATTNVYTGTPQTFADMKASSIALLGNAGSLPDYLLPGVRAFDGAGNEYIMVELTQTVVPGAGVLISRDGLYTAAVITSTGQGPVGIVAESSSSDQYAWAQISGYYSHVKLVGGSSLLTSLGEFQGATSVSTPSVGVLGRSSSQRSSAYGEFAVINRMFPVEAASTASTSASSETGLYAAAYLDYPFIMRIVTT